MAEPVFPSMLQELRRRLEVGGRYHAPTVFDVSEKQAQQLAGDLEADPKFPRMSQASILEHMQAGKLMLWGVPVVVK